MSVPGGPPQLPPEIAAMLGANGGQQQAPMVPQQPPPLVDPTTNVMRAIDTCALAVITSAGDNPQGAGLLARAARDLMEGFAALHPPTPPPQSAPAPAPGPQA